MLIFNLSSVLQAVVALIPGVAIVGLSLLVGIGSIVPALIVFLGSFALLDAVWRWAASGPRVDEAGIEQPGLGWLSFVLPWKGGHLFFVPNYLSGTAATLLFSYAGLMALIQG